MALSKGHQTWPPLKVLNIFFIFSDPIFIDFGRRPAWNCPSADGLQQGAANMAAKKVQSSSSSNNKDLRSSNSNRELSSSEELDMEGESSIFAPNRSGKKVNQGLSPALPRLIKSQGTGGTPRLR
jgi:hypothetical protein